MSDPLQLWHCLYICTYFLACLWLYVSNPGPKKAVISCGFRTSSVSMGKNQVVALADIYWHTNATMPLWCKWSIVEDVPCEEVDHPLRDPLAHHNHQTLGNICKYHNPASKYLTENISFVQKSCGTRNLPSRISSPCISYGWRWW